MRIGWVIAVAVLAAGCSAPGGSGGSPVEAGRTGQPDSGTDSRPAPDGGIGPADGGPASDGPGQADAGAGAGRSAYRLISLATPARPSSTVDAMAANGFVLARGLRGANPDLRYVVDPHSSAVFGVPANVRAINSNRILAGFRPRGDCNDFEAFLLFPDGSTKGLGTPLRPTPGPSRCEEPIHWMSGMDDQARLAVTWGDGAGSHPYLWDGTAWRLQSPPHAQGAVAGFAADLAAGWSGDEAVLWRDGVAIGLGPGRAWALNSKGLIAGEEDAVATAWVGSTATRLSVPAGWLVSRARTVGESGDLGGSMGAAVGWSVEHGFVSSNGTVYDANDLLDSHELLVTEVTGIASDGTIAGRALDMKGNAQGFAAVRTGAPLRADTAWRDGGRVLARGQSAIGLATDRRTVSWIGPRSLQGGWVVRSVPKGGGPVVTLAEGPDSETTDGPIVAGGGYVFFRTWEGYTSAHIRRVAVSGGPVETMATSFADFAADDTFLYRRDRSDGSLVRVAHAGGAPVVLDTAPGSGLATSGSELWYGVTGTSGGTLRNVRSGGSPVKDLFPPVSYFSFFESIRVDSLYVYFEASTRMFHGFFRVSRNGGKPEPLPFDGVVAGWDASGQQLFWAQPFVADGRFRGCLIQTAADGSGPECIDTGPFRYQGPRADPDAVYVIRDLDIVRIAR